MNPMMKHPWGCNCYRCFLEVAEVRTMKVARQFSISAFAYVYRVVSDERAKEIESFGGVTVMDPLYFVEYLEKQGAVTIEPVKSFAQRV
jgi:hypothetical protein